MIFYDRACQFLEEDLQQYKSYGFVDFIGAESVPDAIATKQQLINDQFIRVSKFMPQKLMFDLHAISDKLTYAMLKKMEQGTSEGKKSVHTANNILQKLGLYFLNKLFQIMTYFYLKNLINKQGSFAYKNTWFFIEIFLWLIRLTEFAVERPNFMIFQILPLLHFKIFQFFLWTCSYLSKSYLILHPRA